MEFTCYLRWNLLIFEIQIHLFFFLLFFMFANANEFFLIKERESKISSHLIPTESLINNSMVGWDRDIFWDFTLSFIILAHVTWWETGEKPWTKIEFWWQLLETNLDIKLIFSYPRRNSGNPNKNEKTFYKIILNSVSAENVRKNTEFEKKW